MDWLEANVLSKLQQQLQPRQPQSRAEKLGSQGAAQAQLTPSVQHEAAGRKRQEFQMSPTPPAWARGCSTCDCSGTAEKGPAGATEEGATEEAGLRPGPTGV